ncbi:signal recognition particle receptor subunit alpha-like [Pseudoliparis swirei]|uniref:signal recognition particle receptor subunit alpha-like n=1 Tax=Pseudoliparis swirei TaxID=2059687 RepID=UPI0024BEFAF3|nr:signal recognition particle receptor subunit alpha-like [Pseudoliparis swirei]XP_056297713.1 signal recognition particle receptor subunit alpha-like [Pseudoliparis swirei]
MGPVTNARLNSLHPPERHEGRPVVQLYEKGYGKDAAGIATEAIAYARNQAFDVVLVDTAGRMQDNAPLMTVLRETTSRSERHCMRCSAFRKTDHWFWSQDAHAGLLSFFQIQASLCG